MKKKSIKVQGLKISIKAVEKEDFVSLTDIARQSERPSHELIKDWLRNKNTLLFLEAWETLHNPDFKQGQMPLFIKKAADNRKSITPKLFIETLNAIGITSTQGRYGGTFAHKDIALNFCYWLSPVFQVYFIKEFDRLKEEEFSRKNLEWHIRRITDNIEDVRNLLDTIPGQDESRKRIK